MVRSRLLAVIGMTLIVTCVIVCQPNHAAHGTPPVEVLEAEFGENTEENACHRWQCNQARHWRYVVTQR